MIYIYFHLRHLAKHCAKHNQSHLFNLLCKQLFNCEHCFHLFVLVQHTVFCFCTYTSVHLILNGEHNIVSSLKYLLSINLVSCAEKNFSISNKGKQLIALFQNSNVILVLTYYQKRYITVKRILKMCQGQCFQNISIHKITIYLKLLYYVVVVVKCASLLNASIPYILNILTWFRH